ncbi:hypothetical protein C2G38_2226594 [Gigaspora rosea]|uniref:BTB domain-containing protein n=1 Tax=Gigaspora rosea TaxID=44941 RepID=A0A397TXZ5_9GLOM|nr:hypothetical protein C2G38_2226594 [Gigaspora rosea]
MATKFFEKISSNLSDLLLNENEYNVIIEVGQAPSYIVFKAHSFILNSRCLYSKDKLRDVAYENGVKTIKKTDILIEMFDTIIIFDDNNFNDLQHFCTSIIAKYPNIGFDFDEFISLSENALVSILKLDNLQMDECIFKKVRPSLSRHGFTVYQLLTIITIITDDNENEMELNNKYELRIRAKYYFKMKIYEEAIEY